MIIIIRSDRVRNGGEGILFYLFKDATLQRRRET